MPPRLASALAAVVLAATLAGPVRADFVFGDYVFTQVHVPDQFITALRFAPDGRLFTTELITGRVRVYADTSTAAPSSVWAELPVRWGDGERGLVGLALHPQFADSPYVYVFYHPAGTDFGRIARLRDAGGVGVDFAVIRDSLPGSEAVHHGGRLEFGPDGMLYVTRGDQGDWQLSPLTTGTEGRILRLTPMGRPAPGNAFGPGNPSYAIGMRNPFGLCFDAATGRGYFTDNGPNCTDEVNVLFHGANYGWQPLWTCDAVPEGTIPPLFTFTPTVAPTGCTVYRGARLPALHGSLFFGSYNDGTLYRVPLDAVDPWASGPLEAFVVSESGSVLDVTTGPDDLLWLSGGAGIYKIRPFEVVNAAPGAAAGAPLAVAPNPSRRAVTFALGGRAADRLEVLDVTGRRVRAWDGPLAGEVRWDGRDGAGAEARPGVYFARAWRGGTADTRSFVRLGP